MMERSRVSWMIFRIEVASFRDVGRGHTGHRNVYCGIGRDMAVQVSSRVKSTQPQPNGANKASGTGLNL
jgi:hypothetical protein